MIVIYHHKNRITKVISEGTIELSFNRNSSIACELLEIAAQFPKTIICWCSNHNQRNLNIKEVNKLFHHQKMMLSYNPSPSNYFDERIGYVEQTPFINVNKKVCYPTWQMSSEVGVIHASVLNALTERNPVVDFDYFINSLAKLLMPKGLICYSQPKLLKGANRKNAPKASRFKLYKFVKQHYKLRWLFLLFFNELIYERKIALFSFINALFYKSKRKTTINLNAIDVNVTIKTIKETTIDVIIPTIGRKKYLYDVLCDLKKQTHLPKNVIIVEQNQVENSVSELDYLTAETWPFNIKHTFIHQSGACNARNIALSKVESEWVFLNDDDNRFEEDLLKNTFQCIQNYGIHALITSYLKPNEKLEYKTTHQTGIFGSGNSFVKASCLKAVAFDMSFEFGYGEDTDFGMQLRHKGYDIMYFPNLKIIHLYAPMGGFRIKPKLAWNNELIQPKPSPTIMLLKLKYDTKTQINGYKLLLFLRLYFNGALINPVSFHKNFQEKWNMSQTWAKKIRTNA